MIRRASVPVGSDGKPRKGSKECKTEKSPFTIHSEEMDVQEIFATLTYPRPPSGERDSSNMYERALRTLDSYFEPQVNIPYERHIFRPVGNPVTATGRIL